jgi:hypoxanthine phosphoribosyltransferase
MPRQEPRTSRELLHIDWALFGELCRALAVHVERGYHPDYVIGIATAGVIPAAIVAAILEAEFGAMTITRRQVGGVPELVAGPPPTVHGRRVLLVDETCDSGDTLKLALNALRVAGPADVRTAVSVRTGEYRPDFFAFETDKVIVLPWD